MVRKGWKQVTLGDIALFQGGSQPPLSFFSSQKKAGYIRLVQIRDYKTDKYATYIPEKLAKRFCKQNDIMIGRYGPPIFQILRGIEGAYNVALIKALPQGVDKEFLYHTLKREDLFEYIDLLSRRTSGQTGVDLTNLKAFELSIPALTDEQAAIAKALSDVDSLTSSLQKLIEKKKAIKQGAMQELLTGKKRLPGFYGEWKREQLPELLQEQNGIKIGPFGSQLKKEYLIDIGEFKVYGQENVYEKDFRLGTRYISKERYLKLKSCELLPGDFVISSMGTVGKCAIVPQNIQIGIMDSHLIRLKFNCKKIIPQYMLQLFSDEFDFLRNQIEKLSVGGIMDGLSTKIVQSLNVFYPVNIDEQKAICAILNDMDGEIAQLEKKLAKYQQIKQGMMQELLTGRIRLIGTDRGDISEV